MTLAWKLDMLQSSENLLSELLLSFQRLLLVRASILTFVNMGKQAPSELESGQAKTNNRREVEG